MICSVHLSSNQFPNNCLWNEQHLNFSLPEIRYLQFSLLFSSFKLRALFFFQIYLFIYFFCAELRHISTSFQGVSCNCIATSKGFPSQAMLNFELPQLQMPRFKAMLDMSFLQSFTLWLQHDHALNFTSFCR